MKIIHIVENLDKGAVETLLVRIFIESKKYRPGWKWTFYCIVGREGRLDKMVKNAGGEIIYSPVTVSSKMAFLKNLRKVLKEGKYDIIHSHHDYLSGFYLLASAGIKYKKRVLHIHNTDKSLPIGNRVFRNLLLKPFKQLGLYYSDTIVGVSREALNEFIGNGGRKNIKYTVLYHGIDFNHFDIEPKPEELRVALNIPVDAKIGLFVGRMNDLKNPVFVIEIMKHIVDSRKNVYAVFVGSGDMEMPVRAKAKEYKIEDYVRVAGWHEDVPMLMKSSDVFIYPRKEYPKEALGVVIVEAQAAGLPMFITHGIVGDAIVISELAHYNDLTNPADWSRHIIQILDKPPAISQQACLEEMRRSQFELSNAAKNLIHLYEN